MTTMRETLRHLPGTQGGNQANDPVRPPEPAEPPFPPEPPTPPRPPSLRYQIAWWMERTFGRAYLPVAALGAGTITGGAAFAAGKLLHGNKLGIALAVPAALAGAFLGAVLVFSD